MELIIGTPPKILLKNALIKLEFSVFIVEYIPMI